jgi:hypothetical protein
MHKNAMKCNKTLSKWCKNKHGASKIIDTFETYQFAASKMRWRGQGGALGRGEEVRGEWRGSGLPASPVSSGRACRSADLRWVISLRLSFDLGGKQRERRAVRRGYLWRGPWLGEGARVARGRGDGWQRAPPCVPGTLARGRWRCWWVGPERQRGREEEPIPVQLGCGLGRGLDLRLGRFGPPGLFSLFLFLIYYFFYNFFNKASKQFKPLSEIF